ncbi:MAG: hypothetical protein ACK41T_07830 [Pseudobdellovibrio sp.]
MKKSVLTMVVMSCLMASTAMAECALKKMNNSVGRFDNSTNFYAMQLKKGQLQQSNGNSQKVSITN